MIQQPFSKKQAQFMIEAQAKWNLAHGSVRSGKTVGITFAFMAAVDDCLDTDIYIVGHTSDTAYRNVITMIMTDPVFSIFRPYCVWSNRKLYYKDKVITVLGAKDEGAIGNFQGLTMSLCYCDEITLYPDSIIDMIDTRLSRAHSRGFATMNPSYPEHKIKKWIDLAEQGDPNYYQLHFSLEDNPYVDDTYKQRIRNSLSGVFYKRNYLGLWCLAEGAIFDFFERSIYVVSKPPTSAEYWIVGIDYGASNPFACILVGVNTGKHTQTGLTMWVEKEYYWDPKKEGRQKTNREFGEDVVKFLEPYSIKSLYIDPSAASFKTELRQYGYHPVDANNDVEDGIRVLTSTMKEGKLFICSECKNTIREIESYVWDSKRAERGYDEPLKKNDHTVDALRYAIMTHKPEKYDPFKKTTTNEQYLVNRFAPQTRGFR
jgi:PBSX family phage terminase large subunit